MPGCTSILQMDDTCALWGNQGQTKANSVCRTISRRTETAGCMLPTERTSVFRLFDPNGNYEAQFGLNLSRPGCVCVDHSNGEKLVYVGEFFGGFSTNSTGMRLGPRVSILDADGKALARLGDQSFGDDPGRFYSPHGIAVDSRGDVYVAEVSRTETYGGQIAPLADPARERRSLQKLVRKI